MNTKQVLVMRHDLEMRKGKYGAQCSHAAFEWMRDRLISLNDPDRTPYEGYRDFNLSITYFELCWLTDELHKKIVCKVDSEQALLDVYHQAREAGLNAYLITDMGLTEFNGVPTLTAVGIGPNCDEDVDVVTKSLKLA